MITSKRNREREMVTVVDNGRRVMRMKTDQGKGRDGGFGSEGKVTGERKASVRKRKIEEIS